LEEFHERENERYTSSIKCLKLPTVKNVNYIKHFFPETKNKFCNKINKLIDVCKFLDISLIKLIKKTRYAITNSMKLAIEMKKKVKYAK